MDIADITFQWVDLGSDLADHPNGKKNFKEHDKIKDIHDFIIKTKQTNYELLTYFFTDFWNQVLVISQNFNVSFIGLNSTYSNYVKF